jgi:hypothetical protein
MQPVEDMVAKAVQTVADMGYLLNFFPDLTQQVALQILEKASMVLDLAFDLLLQED